MKQTFLLLAMALLCGACNDMATQQAGITHDTVATSATAPRNDKSIEQYQAMLQGKWVATSDTNNFYIISGSTMSMNADGSEKMNFTLSLSPCDKEAKAVMDERYAGAHVIWLTKNISSMDQGIECLGIIGLKENEFTLADAGSMGETTYMRVQ